MAQNSANKCLGPKKEGATISTEIPEDKHGIPGQIRYEYERAGQVKLFEGTIFFSCPQAVLYFLGACFSIRR